MASVTAGSRGRASTRHFTMRQVAEEKADRAQLRTQETKAEGDITLYSTSQRIPLNQSTTAFRVSLLVLFIIFVVRRSPSSGGSRHQSPLYETNQAKTQFRSIRVIPCPRPLSLISYELFSIAYPGKLHSPR